MIPALTGSIYVPVLGDILPAPRMDRARQSSLANFFPETRQTGKVSFKMAPGQKASQHHTETLPKMVASLIPSPRSVSDSAPPASPGSVSSQDHSSDLVDLMGDGDLKRHIGSLPTREDLERFTARVEKAFTQDIAQLKADTAHLRDRVETLEQ